MLRTGGDGARLPLAAAHNALLLMIFGGGCTLIVAGLMADDFPASLTNELGLLLSMWLPFGVLPLVGGYLLIRLAMTLRRKGREDRPPQG